MDNRAKVALEKSIKHWEGIRDGSEIDNGIKTCPLCQEFKFGILVECGTDCPIVKAGYRNCSYTPYIEWTDHFYDEHPLYEGDHRVICDKCKELAQKEVDFLKDLLEKAESEEYVKVLDKIRMPFFDNSEWTIFSDDIRPASLDENECSVIRLVCLDTSNIWYGTVHGCGKLHVDNAFRISKEDLIEYYALNKDVEFITQENE